MSIERYTHKFMSQWSEVFGPEADRESFLYELNHILGESERLQSTYPCVRNDAPYQVLSIFVHFDKRLVLWVDEYKHCAVGMRRFAPARKHFPRLAPAPAGAGGTR